MHGVIFYPQAQFLLNPARFLLNPAALTELATVAADDGDPADGGSPKGAVLALTAASAPSECLSVASYRFLHHTAVSFVSSDIRVFTAGTGRDSDTNATRPLPRKRRNRPGSVEKQARKRARHGSPWPGGGPDSSAPAI